MTEGGTVCVRPTNLKLVSRGNVWKYYHNEPLEFADLREEAEFYHNIGRTKEVRNPKDDLYHWDDYAGKVSEPVEALQAIKDGLGDSMNVGSLFGLMSSPRITVYKFLDREVGERVRKATLEGFGWTI